MTSMPNNSAFIDSNNVRLGIKKALGWNLDWKRLRIHLKDSYGVSCAYIFIGRLPENERLYTNLQKWGYVIVFKEVTYEPGGKPKGNVDAELVLQAMIDYNEYEKAVIVTGDGDFTCLVRYIVEKGKLERVLAPNRPKCSALLKRAAKAKIDFLEDARGKLEYKKGTPGVP